MASAPLPRTNTPRHDPLPCAMPDGYGARLFLFAVRRMASGGVDDAHAANALLGAFGRSYRRPLVLMRAMMLELSRASNRKIQVAPCCCGRMTADEAMLVAAASEALDDGPAAYRRAAALIASEGALGALTCIQAVAQSYADLGHPLRLFGT